MVAELAALLDLLGELGQALGVEGVGRVEDADVGLIEARQRGVFELKPVRGQREATSRYLAHKTAAAGMDLFHRHGGGDRRHARPRTGPAPSP